MLMSCIDAVKTFALSHPEKLACVELESDRRWNYRELDQTINAIARWLVGSLGPRSAERVICLSKNCAELLMLNIACVRAGAIFVPLNWRLSHTELEVLVADCRPKLALVGKEFAEHSFVQEQYRLPELLALTRAYSGETLSSDVRQAWEAPSTILYTSGTTGRPKGVMLSEENCFWSMYNFSSGFETGPNSVFLCDMPMFHTAGLLANSRSAFQAGGELLITSGFDVDNTLLLLGSDEWGVTHYFSAPQMAQMLWNHPNFKADKLRRLKVYVTGGAPMPKALVDRFVNAGIPLSCGFGMTEAGSVSNVPVSNPELAVEKAGSIGVPSMAVEMVVVDQNGAMIADGEPGELWLRGPAITAGYWEQPEATKKAFTNGWFMTGDIAMRDQDGFFFLIDRKKDMFISGGENVYPAEVEACIAQIADIAEVVVVGVPDEKWGETGVAVVVPVSGKAVSQGEIVAHCLSRLAKYKVPKRVYLTDSIPRNSSGKAQKNRVVEAIEQGRI